MEKDDAFTVVTSGEPVRSLTLRRYPIPLSFAIFDEYAFVAISLSPTWDSHLPALWDPLWDFSTYILADPTAEEEVRKNK